MDFYNLVVVTLLGSIGYFLNNLSSDVKTIANKITDLSITAAVSKSQIDTHDKEIKEIKTELKNLKPSI